MDGHAQVVPDISLIRNTDISAFVVANESQPDCNTFHPSEGTQNYVMLQRI